MVKDGGERDEVAKSPSQRVCVLWTGSIISSTSASCTASDKHRTYRSSSLILPDFRNWWVFQAGTLFFEKKGYQPSALYPLAVPTPSSTATR